MDQLTTVDNGDPTRPHDPRASERRRNIIAGVVGLVVIAIITSYTFFGMQHSTSDRVALTGDVTTYPVDSANHTTDPVTYPQNPPVGGDHNPEWLNCGIYDAPVHNENAVHSMEHGAVWVTYDPALSAADVEALRAQMPSSYVVLSPYPGLPAPVVASAWGVQVQLDGVNDPRLKTFLDVYRQGSQTPEPGATCGGGVGTPIG